MSPPIIYLKFDMMWENIRKRFFRVDRKSSGYSFNCIVVKSKDVVGKETISSHFTFFLLPDH